ASAIPDKATVIDLATPPADAGNPPSTAGSTSTKGPDRAIWVYVIILVVVGIGASTYLMRRGDTEPAPAGPPEPGADVKSDQAGAVESPAELPQQRGSG